MIKFPVDFQDKLKAPKNMNGGYPYSISAYDLMADFSYAALDVEDDWIEKKNVGEHQGRKLKLPKFPKDGAYILGVVNGRLQWIETEEC